jgi:hypothetical protein
MYLLGICTYSVQRYFFPLYTHVRWKASQAKCICNSVVDRSHVRMPSAEVLVDCSTPAQLPVVLITTSGNLLNRIEKVNETEADAHSPTLALTTNTSCTSTILHKPSGHLTFHEIFFSSFTTSPSSDWTSLLHQYDFFFSLF